MFLWALFLGEKLPGKGVSDSHLVLNTVRLRCSPISISKVFQHLNPAAENTLLSVISGLELGVSAVMSLGSIAVLDGKAGSMVVRAQSIRSLMRN